ncbi:hypothetical protein FPV67DRAFT_66274 [Lyophyllum atratum]|nr:hypothetical protein FPV67DRAFT_66274 [Lyophyllum atratum]
MTLTTLDTIFPADAVEFCPHPDALDIFVCGTYKLAETSGNHRSVADDLTDSTDSAPQRRRGQCLVLQADHGDAIVSSGFRHIQTIDLPAVLDMKWCHRSPSVNAVLGIADSEGSVTLHAWQPEEKALKEVESIRCASADTLCLSLDWSNRRAGGTHLGSLVVSLSNGSLCLLSPSESSSVSLTRSWHAHDYEPWIAAWNYWDTNIIYSGAHHCSGSSVQLTEITSGGDDLKMKGWDIRQDLSQPIFTNKRYDRISGQ